MGFNFPSAPILNQIYNPGAGIAYRWDGQAWVTGNMNFTGDVRYDAAQALTAAQKAQARANIDALKKNYILNGAMQVSQQNGAAAASTNLYYPVDQFFPNFGAVSAVVSVQQVASVTPAGSPNRIRATVTTADTSIAAGDFYTITTKLEGIRIADLRFGYASPKTMTLQMGVRAPAGVYCVGINNGGFNRSIVGEFTISAGEANTDVVKSMIFTGDLSGTWTTDNSTGFVIFITLAAGSSFQATAGSWVAGNAFVTTNQFNFLGTVGNVFELFDVGLYEGAVAPAFQVPFFQDELRRCQRYWRAIIPEGAGTNNTASQAWFTIRHEGMRAAPSVSATAPLTITNVISANYTQSSVSAAVFSNTPDWGHYNFNNFSGLGTNVILLFRAGGLVAFDARL